MSDERRALRWAQDVWRASPPSEAELSLGADRIARRFAVRRRAVTAHRAWVTAGATAAFLGTLAYAGRGTWPEPSSSPSRRVALSESAEAESTPPAAPLPGPAPANGADPRVRQGDAPRREAAPEKLEGAVERPPSDTGRRTSDAVRRPSSPRPAEEPTWNDVSDALAVLDHARAETLLRELTAPAHDSNTRAKAYLGLAQLDESRKDCKAATGHALRAASIPDIDIKTVRRALELAARCSR